MLIPERGVHQLSERYFFTPSAMAKELFYYPTRCGHYFCSNVYSFDHRSEIAMQGDHNENIMLFAIQDGALELEINGKTMLATTGQIVLFDCSQPYRYSGTDGLEFYWLLFNGLNTRAFYHKIMQAHNDRHVFTTSTHAEILSELNRMLTGCAAEERLTEAGYSQLIHRLLCLMLLEENNAQTDKNSFVAQAIKYMNHHMYEPLSVAMVAEAVNLSPAHFSRQFKRFTGHSPYEYLVLRRIDRAKYMLTSTQMTVKEIAYTIGYNSEENFIHSFQKNVGISPGLFRKYPI